MDWPTILQQTFDNVKSEIGAGKVADYIPALAAVDPSSFALSVVTLDGEHYGIGAVDEAFSTQSISKVFTLSIALELVGPELWKRVGREPSGSPFNSIVQLEQERGIPRNPLINAGALVVTDTLVSRYGTDTIPVLLAQMQALSGSFNVHIDHHVAASEREWGHRNRALAWFMKSFGVLTHPDPNAVLDAYFEQCALAMSTRELATAGLFLAHDGTHPVSGIPVTSHDRVNRINALMLTCGHYDMSGDFAFRVGLAGKSGVGGGILAIAPRVGAIAVWSPALNASGNSHAGTLALEHVSRLAGLNLF